MHPAALGATSYILLLSSLVTLAILLRGRCKSKKSSPFHALSTSDVLSAALTAVVFLANHIEAVIKLSYNSRNSTSDTLNRTWIVENEGKYKLPFPPIHNLRDTADEDDLNVTLTCDMKDVLMQYGMLLATLTNAFVSLLTFAVQCNLDAACVKRRCASVMKSSENTQLEVKNARRGRGIPEERESMSRRSRDIKVNCFIRRMISRSRRSQMREDDRKPVGFLVTSHWLVPLLVVGVLCFAEYSDTSVLRHAEDVECEFESNFPMFYVLSDPEEESKIVNSVVPLENGYLVDRELSNLSTPSIVEVNRIVSKIQSIVRTALNYASNSTASVNLPGNSGLRNTTKYIVASDVMNYITNNTSVNNATRGLNDTLMERDASIHQYDSSANPFIDQNVKVTFRDLLKNASEESDTATFESPSDAAPQESIRDDNAEDASIYFKEENRTGSVPGIVRNGTSISNNQIYDEIIKRIQAAGAHVAKRNNLRGYVAKRKPNSIRDSLAGKIDDPDTKMQSGLLRVANECLVSSEFLKLHLFTLCLAIYFLSILLSCILQVRGKYVCKNTLATLRTRTDLSTPPQLCSNVDSKEDAATVDEPHAVFRSSTDREKEGSSSPQEPRNDRSSGTGTEETRKEQSYKETQNKSAFLEINRMLRTLNIIRLALILCVILWTPALLGTLLKVFSCTRTPQWLTDATLLSAVSFGIVRNILNISIIKIQEACSEAGKKENKIHPIK